MVEIILNALSRPVPTLKLNQLRKTGKIPVELYGQNKPNQHLLVNQLEFERVYHQAGESHLVDLNIDSLKPLKVMIHSLSHHPVTGQIEHIDLYQVDMEKELMVNIPLVFIGEAKAVKELGGTLVTPLEFIEVSCLPKDLISRLEVDISPLQSFGDVIRVENLRLSDKVKILTNPRETVALVLAQVVETVAPVAAEAAVPVAEAGAEAEAVKPESAVAEAKAAK